MALPSPGDTSQERLAKQLSMNAQKRPTLAQTQKSSCGTRMGLTKSLDDFNSQDLDEFNTMQNNTWENVRGKWIDPGWGFEGT